jgi:hypothetical protein
MARGERDERSYKSINGLIACNLYSFRNFGILHEPFQ